MPAPAFTDELTRLREYMLMLKRPKDHCLQARIPHTNPIKPRKVKDGSSVTAGSVQQDSTANGQFVGRGDLGGHACQSAVKP